MSISYERDDLPWYKYFWPWFFIMMPLITVVAGISMIVIASYEPDGLVSDDYYKRGLAINRVLERDRRAAALGLQATGRIDVEKKLVFLTLDGRLALPTSLQLSILHPTQARQDQIVVLQRQGDSNEYMGVLTGIGAGDWHMMLQPDDGEWRLPGRMTWPGNGTWTLVPTIIN